MVIRTICFLPDHLLYPRCGDGVHREILQVLKRANGIRAMTGKLPESQASRGRADDVASAGALRDPASRAVPGRVAASERPLVEATLEGSAAGDDGPPW
jgi:hypothetical protein